MIQKALEKDRAVRYQHASEIRADLARARRDTGSGFIARDNDSAADESAGSGVCWRSGAAGIGWIVAVAMAWGIGPPENSSAPATIAVLPFQNLGANKDEDFLRMALPDEVVVTLSSVRSLSIRPFATTAKYAKPDVDLQQAGKDMHVGRIVTGRYQRVRDSLQLTLEAVDVADDRVLWQEAMDLPG